MRVYVRVKVWVCDMYVHLIVECSCGTEGSPWGHIHPGACAHTTTQRPASEAGGRGASLASVEAMDVHDDDDVDDDSGDD